MKKLLSILTITTLTASVPAPLLANTLETRIKRDVSTLTSNANNDYLPIKQIKGVTGITISSSIRFVFDSFNNIYFNTDNGIYKLTMGSDTANTIITNIVGYVKTIAVDTSNNIYFGSNNGAFILKNGETTPTKIIWYSALSIIIDSNDNIYFGSGQGIYLF